MDTQTATATIMAKTFSGTLKNDAVQPIMRRLLRYREVAVALGLSESAVKNMAYRGEIRTIRIASSVRIPCEEIDRIVTGRAVLTAIDKSTAP